MSYFFMSSSSPAPLKGTIRVKKPIRGLGPVTDVDGKNWDIKGVIGDYVQAVPYNELLGYYWDTSTTDFFNQGTMGSGIVSQRWDPYEVEVVKEGE